MKNLSLNNIFLIFRTNKGYLDRKNLRLFKKVNMNLKIISLKLHSKALNRIKTLTVYHLEIYKNK